MAMETRRAILVLIISLIGLFLLIFFVVDKVFAPITQYGIVVDAGSTGTRLNVFRWRNLERYDMQPKFEFIFENRSGAKMVKMDSEQSPELKQFSETIEVFFENYKTKDSNVRKNTNLVVGATAGMRQLREKNISKVNLIVSNIDKMLANLKLKTPYYPNYTTIISGHDEALYSIVGVCYEKIILKSVSSNKWSRPIKDFERHGILELGGSSIQIAYQLEVCSKNKEADQYDHFSILGMLYCFNVVSFPCWGTKVFEDIFLNYLKTENQTNKISPCHPDGFEVVFIPSSLNEHTCINSHVDGNNIVFVGNFNKDKCYTELHNALESDKSLSENLMKVKSLKIDEIRLFLLGSYKYTINDLNIESDFGIQYEKIVIENCNKGGKKIESKYCFNAIYGTFLLFHLLKIDHNLIQNKTSDYFTWTVGKLLKDSEKIPIATSIFYYIQIGTFITIGSTIMLLAVVILVKPFIKECFN